MGDNVRASLPKDMRAPSEEKLHKWRNGSGGGFEHVSDTYGKGGGHNRTVKVKRAVARELCTPGL